MKTDWYLTRGSGAVALILLSASVVLGVAAVGRLRSERTPRFVVHGLHRTVSLVAVAFLLVHIATAVLDSFAPISLLDGVVPFAGVYRPLWLGFGAIGFDLVLAVVVSSLIRARVGYRAWRGIHWLSYAAWPVAVLHGFGTGSDVRQTWMLAIVIACIAVVLASVAARAVIGWPSNLRLRVSALGLTAAFTAGLVIWLPLGPFAPHWASRSGTPSHLLAPSALRGGHA